MAAERERITKEYAELLRARTRGRCSSKSSGLARTVFPYVENHNFYIEHWSLGVFWRKMRELSRLFIKRGLLVRSRMVCSISTATEARDALFDYCSAWAVGVADRSALLAEADRAAPKEYRCGLQHKRRSRR